MLNRLVLSVLFVVAVTVTKAQTLVFGGFASFAISDSSSANSGGSMVWQDTRTRCIMVQGGQIFGQSEMYNANGTFKESCEDETVDVDLRLYPNPGYGQYWLEGSGISSVQVYDNTGRFLSRMDVVLSDKQRINISIANQPEGNYFVKVNGIEGLNRVFSVIKLKP